MRGLLNRMPRRSSSGAHGLLPSAKSRGSAVTYSFSTLFAWTFSSGAVFWRIWPAVLLHTLFATGITILSLRTKVDLGVSNMMLTVLGVVIGFVISYRFSVGYEQYWMGRTAWSDAVKHTQTLTRLIWFHVPLRLTPKTKEELAQKVAPLRPKEEMETVMREKRAAVDLIAAFTIAVKHHLRGEPGIFYEDLYHLVRPLHEHHTHGIVSSSPIDLNPPSSSRDRSERDPLLPSKPAYGSVSLERSVSGSGSTQSVPPPLLPASRDHSPSLFDRVASDLIPFVAYLRGISKFYGSCDEQPGIDIDSHGGIQRRWKTGVPASGPKVFKRIASGNENLPVEILRMLSDWFAVLEERGTVPGTSLGGMIGTIAALEDYWCAAEKTLTTPLPFVYAVHIRTVWLYLFFLPFQLVAEFSWYTIPGVAIASFIYLGFLAAGDEIGQPFGYDENDLDLDLICREMILADLSRLKETRGVNVFLGSREATTQPHEVLAEPVADLLEM